MYSTDIKLSVGLSTNKHPHYTPPAPPPELLANLAAWTNQTTGPIYFHLSSLFGILLDSLLGMFEYRLFKKTSGPKKEKVEERTAGDHILRRHLFGASHQIIFAWWNQDEMGGECGTHGGKEKMQTGFWCGNLRETDHLGNLDVDGELILK
jgi:hypothetical protein